MNIKILIITCFLIFVNSTYSQEIYRENGEGQYMSEQIIEIENTVKSELFDNAMEWVAITCNSAQDVIQYTNRENGKIICKGSFPTDLFMKSGQIRHTLTLDFKDRRYRQTYSNFSYCCSGSVEIAFKSKSMGFKKKIYRETNNIIKLSTYSLKNYLICGKSDDDW